MIGWKQPGNLELLWNLDPNPGVLWNREQLGNLQSSVIDDLSVYIVVLIAPVKITTSLE